MAAHITPRSIVQYGSMLLAIVIVYNLGRHLRTGDGPSKAEEDLARLLSRQQRMDGDVKQMRNLIEDLRSDLKSASSAQADAAKAVRLAAEQEAGKQAAAVMAELQSSQAALTKLGRVAAAQQQQIEAVQAKLHMAVSADSQHEAALMALREEHAKHLADSIRADRSVREQDALAAVAQQQKQLRQEGSSGKGNSNQLGRKQGAALLPKRTSSAADAAAGAAAATGNGTVSTAQRAGSRADVGASDARTSDGNQSSSQLGSTARLDQHAQQQVLAGRDPRKIVAAHQAGASAAAPEGDAQGSSGLADAHAAALAARKAEHAERRQAASGEAAQLAGGGGIAGAVSGMTANRPTGSPGAEDVVDPAAASGLTGGTLAGSRQADQAQLVAGGNRGAGALARAAGGLRGQRDAAAPAAAAAIGEVTARELVQALDQGGAASSVASTAASAGGKSSLGEVLADPVTARAAMLDAAKAVHATRNADAGGADAGGASGSGARLQDAAAAQRAAIMAAAGKAAHEQRLAAAAGGGSGDGSSQSPEGSSELDISSLQRAAAVRLAGSQTSDVGSVFGSSGSDLVGGGAGGLDGGSSSGREASRTGGSGGGGDLMRGSQAGKSEADPLQAFEAVLNSRAATNE